MPDRPVANQPAPADLGALFGVGRATTDGGAFGGTTGTADGDTFIRGEVPEPEESRIITHRNPSEPDTAEPASEATLADVPGSFAVDAAAFAPADTARKAQKG